MTIFPLPQFEADVAEADREAYERLKPPSSIVVRFGRMRMIGEFAYDGQAKPGCGSKLVVRTPRGLEIGEMLTSTCPNAGCSKSVTRKQMLEYIENSGGTEYPFYSEGKVQRVATIDDLNRQARLEEQIPDLVRTARAYVAELGLPMKVVDAEPILGGERLTYYFTSEERVDFRELVRLLARDHGARIELRQVGARDEARLTADYERCGQHCCCKQFLKVLKPVSMRSAKVQKATLDPLKISGRCGRLMCCLRYEDETYESLRKRLPKRKARVGTPDGPGIVLDTQILTQLVLVLLDGSETRIAVPVESLSDPDAAPPPKPADPFRGMKERDVAARTGDAGRQARGRSRADQQDARRARAQRPDGPAAQAETPDAHDATGGATGGDTGGGSQGGPGQQQKRGRRRRRRGRAPGQREGGGQAREQGDGGGRGPQQGAQPGSQQGSQSGPPQGGGEGEGGGRKRRGRRRGRGRGRDERDDRGPSSGGGFGSDRPER